MLKKTVSLLLVAALALLSVPVSAQTAESYAPRTVWGHVPESLRPHASTAALQDASASELAKVPIVGDRFVFPNVPAGSYTALLHNKDGVPIASSEAISLPHDGVAEARFSSDKVPGAVASSKAHGITTGGWIAIGAAACGITGGIVYHHHHHHGNASPSR